MVLEMLRWDFTKGGDILVLEILRWDLTENELGTTVVELTK